MERGRGRTGKDGGTSSRSRPARGWAPSEWKGTNKPTFLLTRRRCLISRRMPDKPAGDGRKLGGALSECGNMGRKQTGTPNKPAGVHCNLLINLIASAAWVVTTGKVLYLIEMYYTDWPVIICKGRRLQLMRRTSHWLATRRASADF